MAPNVAGPFQERVAGAVRHAEDGNAGWSGTLRSGTLRDSSLRTAMRAGAARGDMPATDFIVEY